MSKRKYTVGTTAVGALIYLVTCVSYDAIWGEWPSKSQAIGLLALAFLGTWIAVLGLLLVVRAISERRPLE